ncbi:MAG: hypothetical protein M1819_002853 [Sarea resinae]|nr:MAG: hypothetical protein M1819_002853 [Sarea resinae]
MVDWIGLAVPFAYLSILVGSLATFSSLYRKRKAVKAASLSPWFPAHLQRNIYLTLLHLSPAETTTSANTTKTVAVPDSVLRAALLRRAVEDINRILSIRTAKTALTALLARGSIGDDLWQQFLIAEKEIEEELRDVVTEANAFAPGWGSTIFQTANEMVHQKIVRDKIEEVQKTKVEEGLWWEKRRQNIQEEFLKELDGGEESAKEKEREKAVAAPTGTTTGSEEDGVLVENGTGTPGTPAGGNAGSVGKAGGKKKKGKK